MKGTVLYMEGTSMYNTQYDTYMERTVYEENFS